MKSPFPSDTYALELYTFRRRRKSMTSFPGADWLGLAFPHAFCDMHAMFAFVLSSLLSQRSLSIVSLPARPANGPRTTATTARPIAKNEVDIGKIMAVAPSCFMDVCRVSLRELPSRQNTFYRKLFPLKTTVYFARM